MKAPPEELIERYQVAFAHCNPHRPRPNIKYVNGWFRFYSEIGVPSSGYRRTDFEGLTGTLETRAVTAYPQRQGDRG